MLTDDNMGDYFDDIAAIASGSTRPLSMEDAVKAYEKDGVQRMLKLWKRSVVL
jgi:hypothetical protein